MGAGEIIAAQGVQAMGGAVQGMIGGAINDYWSRKSEERAYKRQLDMYNMMREDNSPAARRKQLEDAGLSVGLMYGGPTGAGGGSASGVSAGNGSVSTSLHQGINLMEIKTQMKQLEVMEAQRKDLEAAAKLKEVDANKKAGADTGNVEADTAIKKIQADGMKIQNEIALATKDNVIEKVEAELGKLTNEVEILITEGKILDANKENIIKETVARINNVITDTALKKANIKLDYQKTENLKIEIEKMLIETKAIQFNAVTNRFEALTNRKEYQFEGFKLRLEHKLKEMGYTKDIAQSLISALSTIMGASMLSGIFGKPEKMTETYTKNVYDTKTGGVIQKTFKKEN